MTSNTTIEVTFTTDDAKRLSRGFYSSALLMLRCRYLFTRVRASFRFKCVFRSMCFSSSIDVCHFVVLRWERKHDSSAFRLLWCAATACHFISSSPFLLCCWFALWVWHTKLNDRKMYTRWHQRSFHWKWSLFSKLVYIFLLFYPKSKPHTEQKLLVDQLLSVFVFAKWNFICILCVRIYFPLLHLPIFRLPFSSFHFYISILLHSFSVSFCRQHWSARQRQALMADKKKPKEKRNTSGLSTIE